MVYVPDRQGWVVEARHFDSVDVILASPAGVNHLGFNNADAQWMQLRQFGPPAAITAGEAIMLRPADVDIVIKTSWRWAQAHAGHPRCMQLSDEIALGAKAVVLHFAGLAG